METKVNSICQSLLLAALLLASLDTSDASTPLSVHTTSGQLNGIRETLPGLNNTQILKFLSVPYAQPPVGSLRFKRPLAIESPAGVLDASKMGATCPQHRHLTRFISPLLDVDGQHESSEDCLRLNIFAHPLENQTSPAPVIVWIPGEGFDFADARQFDGSYLAARSRSIVVTVQYRVGVLGFLSAPALGITGNMGLHDQLEALRWVNKNIAKFGGDPTRVTLMGRFSGSMSISSLLTAPRQELIRTKEGRLLFSKAALLSGITVQDWIIDNKQVERVPELIEAARKRGFCQKEVDGAACLRSLPIEQLLQISEYGWRLVTDGDLVGTVSPIEAVNKKQLFAEGLEDLLLGQTGQEGTLCLYRHMLQAQSNNYAQLIDEDRLTTRDLHEILADDLATYFRYNATQTSPLSAALESLVGGDEEESQSREKYLNACSFFMVKSHTRRLKRSILARNGLKSNRVDGSKKPVRVHHYELRYKPTFSLAPEYIETGAHGDDIPLIFGLLYKQPASAVDQKDLLMTNKMMGYIENLIHGRESPLDSDLNIELRAPAEKQLAWRGESQIHKIDFEESDCELISKKSQTQEIELIGRVSPRPVVRLIFIENQTPAVNENVKVQSLVELMEQHRKEEQQFESSSHVQTITKSKRLLELHRQASQGEAPWARAAEQVPAASLVNESSFVTMMVFSSCVVIMAVLSLLIGFTVILFRNNMSQSSKNPLQQFPGSPSACNICDDSHADTIENVLRAGRKGDRGAFNSVFAKLRNHNNPQSASQQQQPQSTSTGRAAGESADGLTEG